MFDGDTTLDHGPDLLDGGSCSQAVHPSCPVSPLPANAANKDMVNYNAIDAGRTADLTPNLLDATASQGESDEGDTVRNTESAITGEGDDTVTGNSAANELNTNGGDDTLHVSGDPGSADQVLCAEGSDTVFADADDALYQCETVNPTTGGDDGGGDNGGGTSNTGGTTGPAGGAAESTTPTTSALSPAAQVTSIALELAAAAKALGRCGTTGLLKRNGCRDSFMAPDRGTIVYRLTAATRGQTTLATGKRAVAGPGNCGIKIRATKKGRKRLRKTRTLRATLTLSFTDAHGATTKRSKRIVLRRSRAS